MRIVLILDSSHDCIYTVETCDLSLIFISAIVPPFLWEFCLMIEYILTVDIVIVGKIELSHIFTPPEDLPDESLDTTEWCMPSHRRLNDLRRVQYTKIDRGREHRVMDSHIILIHRILESPEILIVILHEVLEK
jgi:hypothetical protein